MKDYLKYFNIGLMLVMPAIVGVIIGTMLDKAFKTYPVYTVMFLMLGIISGIWSMYKSIRSLI